MNSRRLAESYLSAREMVVAEGYGAEIDWQESRCLGALSESEFLAEAAWVILSSGFRETVIRHLFPRITGSFLDWISADAIVENAEDCRTDALRVFNHTPKIDAIISVSTRVARDRFPKFRERIAEEGIRFIETLPFMGPATSYHLAKNVGLDVVKPDRHLVRLAKCAGCTTPAALCRLIAEQTGDRIAVIDIVLWRYATLNGNYLTLFAS